MGSILRGDTAVNEFEEKMKCAFAYAGGQVGEVLRCLIQAEVAAQLARIQQLQDVLNGASCGGDATPPA